MAVVAMSPNVVSNLFRRDGTCVLCDDRVPLSCPACPEGTACTTILASCKECAHMICAPIEENTDSNSYQPSDGDSSGSSTNVGAIAGGVVGGVAVIAILTYLVWRYCIKSRRQVVAPEEWDGVQAQDDGLEKSFAQARDNRASTHTVGSVADTVFTRASNIIQIAYIPGVTNRTPTSPAVLVPPVPPIPLGHGGSPSATGDQHFFVPGDLRDSTYSGISSFTDRTSYARTSYAPRSSVASTIYGKSVVITPAQTGMRAKPAMVSVKSAHSNFSGGTATPPVPSVNYEKYTGFRPPSPTNSRNSTFSVGSTFLNTATPARAMVVRVGSVKKVNTTKPKTSDSSATSPTSASSAGRDSNVGTIIIDSPAVDQGPFSDPPSPPADRSATHGTATLSAVLQQSTRRASSRATDSPGSRERERSPFGDEHATQD
ncbi:hypothetical protein NEUTE1DRAFT_144536 [Neurospora tetrasperma FGSC 2508]|uniref:Membrane anchor Opy2 N-terminal domain-containing protein n=1 Tax=Neurospora tetrasperma (strain FGSC 2508 / ATCC MYA-4615 / P0657) TaxID=510951 RepID=F8MCL1_NEUT8|nr:uncharacterized protein NEUTE1DRAFT_144536 [Neurospora tetrasperma FGSC 2508]EGO61312.1 hypothetical protein NEUTE1DRAFT_144536 [Neurospora tetrasperma FGSC 2508]EGZ74674.1 hypothetical protein NEUTE2DRAFT_103614 [Neurospora tetrasperma FGSC 2509]